MKEGDFLSDNMNIFLPIDSIEKSKDRTTKNYTIAGWASTGAKDFQEEQIEPFGLDASYLFNHGWVDYEHDKDQVIGFPTSNSYVDPEKGLYVEAELFGDEPQVQGIVKLYKDIKKAKADRNLGFSIEGRVIERDPADNSIVRKVKITGVAVTKNPANPEATWEMLQKSYGKSLDSKSVSKGGVFTAGYGIDPAHQQDGAAYRVESLANHIINVTNILHRDHAEKGDNSTLVRDTAQLLNSRGITDEKVASLFLQITTGISKSKAMQVLDKVKAGRTAIQQASNGVATDDDSDDD